MLKNCNRKELIGKILAVTLSLSTSSTILANNTKQSINQTINNTEQIIGSVNLDIQGKNGESKNISIDLNIDTTKKYNTIINKEYNFTIIFYKDKNTGEILTIYQSLYIDNNINDEFTNAYIAYGKLEKINEGKFYIDFYNNEIRQIKIESK